MIIQEKSIVTLSYSLSDESGNIIDSSDLNGALLYMHGVGRMMPGIERVVTGQEPGFTFSGNISPEEGYGAYNPQHVTPVPRSQFEHLIGQMEVGKLYNFDVGGGNTQLLKVLSIDDEYVTVDANHPYAGETLGLKCKVEDVRSATMEELAALESKSSGCGGHGSGGCCSDSGEHAGSCCSSSGSSGGCCCS